jgi:hypothetical protein
MAEMSWAARQRAVFERAGGYCEYCHSHEENTGQAMHIEHIIPQGGDRLDNLCLSCSSCNLHKARAVQALDSVTGDMVSLFNPRTQQWSVHFAWVGNGDTIAGKTPVGRATVERLKMNIDRLVRARRNWITAGTHPPADEG